MFGTLLLDVSSTYFGPVSISLTIHVQSRFQAMPFVL